MQRKFIKIKSIDEPIGKVICEDGSVHTFRVAVGAVYRMYEDDGITPCIHPDGGGAMYGLAQQVINCSVNEPSDITLSDWKEPTDKKKAN